MTQKVNNKMTSVTVTLSVITVNVSILNIPSKMQAAMECIELYTARDRLWIQMYTWLMAREWKKMQHANVPKYELE